MIQASRVTRLELLERAYEEWVAKNPAPAFLSDNMRKALEVYAKHAYIAGAVAMGEITTSHL